MAAVEKTVRIISDSEGVQVECIENNCFESLPYVFVVSDASGIIDIFSSEEDAEACAGFQRFKAMEKHMEDGDTIKVRRPRFPVMAVVLALICCLSFARGALAADWSKTDILAESLYQGFHAVDTLQTVYISQHPNEYWEKRAEWEIGRHPSRTAVYAFMGSEAVLHAVVTHELISHNAPHWLTTTWESITVAESFDNVYHNHTIGIRMEF